MIDLTSYEHAKFISAGGFTLSGDGDTDNVIALGDACRYLRLTVVNDSEGVWNQNFTLGHVTWSQARTAMLPHYILGDRLPAHMSTFDSDEYEAYALSWFNESWSLNVTECRTEVGNEMNTDGGWALWDSVPDDKLAAYELIYESISNALKTFKASNPSANYTLGGAASTGPTDASFTLDVMNWANANWYIFDFASWHWYTQLVDNETLTTRIGTIRAVDSSMPVILTETGYDAFGNDNLTDESGTTFSTFVIGAYDSGVTDMLFLQSLGADGSGVYTDVPHTVLSPMGEVLLDFINLEWMDYNYMKKYADVVDEFPYDDTLTITGLTSESGHMWTGSGANLPKILDNTLQISGSAGGGNYAFIDVRQPPDYQYADIIWDDDTTSGMVLISSSKGNDLDWMTHFQFTNTQCAIQMRGLDEGSPTIYHTVAYDNAIVEGVTYRIGVHHQGSRFLLELPGSQEYEWAHHKFADVTGRYLCFQPLGAKATKVGCTIMERRYL